MKIIEGRIEGDPSELLQFLDAAGIAPENVISTHPKLYVRWIIIPLCLFISICCSFLIKPDLAGVGKSILIILGIGSIGWATASIHLRFAKHTITWIFCATTFLIFGLSIGLVSEREIYKSGKKLIEGKIE